MNYNDFMTSILYVMRLEVLVVEHLESAVGDEYLGYAYAFRGLIVLNDCCNDAWQCKG